MLRCSEVVGKYFKYNNSDFYQTMIKKDDKYLRFAVDSKGKFKFGVGVDGKGVVYPKDEKLKITKCFALEEMKI